MPRPAFQTGQQSAEMCHGEGDGEWVSHFAQPPLGPVVPLMLFVKPP